MRQRNINTVVSGRVFEKLHVLLYRCVVCSVGDVFPLVPQLVLDLENHDVSSIGDEMRRDDARYLAHVRFPGFGVARVVVSQLAVRAGRHPQRESSGVGFGIHVGARADDHVHAQLLGHGHDGSEVMGPGLEVEDARLGVVVTPVVVNGEGIEAGKPSSVLTRSDDERSLVRHTQQL